jgi:hypothetical protein
MGDNRRPATKKLQVGDRVKLTGEFLRNTGQYVGSEGLSEWVITECHCDLCDTDRFVATNQNANTFELIHRAALDKAIRESGSGRESLMRHFHAGNLYRVGTLDSRNT